MLEALRVHSRAVVELARQLLERLPIHPDA
jgi:hypothetical protein